MTSEPLVALQTSSRPCSRAWPLQLCVSPAKVQRDHQESQEHQGPKAPWGPQGTLAGGAPPGTTDLLDYRVLLASKVIYIDSIQRVNQGVGAISLFYFKIILFNYILIC